MEENKEIQQSEALSASQLVFSQWRNFDIDICTQHLKEKATRICLDRDCPDNLIPVCEFCLDETHLNHRNKSLAMFCENLDKIITNTDENSENTNNAYEAKILNLIKSFEKISNFNVQDLRFLQNKLQEYQNFSINNQIKRLLSELALAKCENRPQDSLRLHKEIKQKITIENNNQIKIMQISAENDIKKFEQELDVDIERIQQQQNILIDILTQQKRSNSVERTNQNQSIDIQRLAKRLYQIDQRLLKIESDSAAQTQRLKQESEQKIPEERRAKEQGKNALQQQIEELRSQQNTDIKTQEDQKVAQN